MADTPLVRKPFTFKELTLLMIKERGIHRGHWHIYTTFGLNATNLLNPDKTFFPAAIIPVMELGIEESKEPNDRSVDASKENPPPARKTKPRK